jgi:hypothetical protein
MARITFTRADVARLLRLPDTEAVDSLIRAKVLEVHAYTTRGLPIFDAEAVRRAAPNVVRRTEEDRSA